MKRPKSFLVGSFLYQVLWETDLKDSEGGGAYGLQDSEHQTVQMDKASGNEDHKREVFVHEVVHALNSRANLDNLVFNGNPKLEEKYAATIAPWLLDWLRMNPEVVAWVMGVDGAEAE